MASKGATIFQRAIAIAVLLTILLFALQLWYIRNARTILKDFITQQSAGKIRLELSQLDINLFSRRLTINEASLLSTDTLKEPISYHVTFSKLSLNVGSVWKLFLNRKLLLDSMKLYDPVIDVMQWRKDTTKLHAKDELSIPQEMGKFYNSMLKALDEFSVRRVFIDNAKIRLINKMNPAAAPVTVSNIFFDLDRTPVRRGNRDVFINNDERVELRTSQQHIAFPDGRHHLSFKSLRLKLFRQRIDLDSCTVTATTTDSLKSNYQIFFKKLSLTGVDFGAMSAQNIIKADSVYCENPVFDINLYRSDAGAKTEMPDADKIIRELTGNLNLAFIGVKNAGIHFDFYGKTKQSFSNSNKDNFEIRGFRINPDSVHPVSIQRFDMTFKDYHYYNEDSSSIYSFGSLQFQNSKILLKDFEIQRSAGRNKIRNEIYIKVPSFELSELDWYQLIFEQKLIAGAAILNKPLINFTRTREGGSGRKINLYDALQTVDSMVSLANVSVLNGNLNMQLGPATSLNVQNIDFNIYSNRLLRSTTKEGLRNAIQSLSFSKGVLRFKDITAELLNARFTDANIIYAGQVAVSGQGNKIAAIVKQVYIDNMQMDDKAETIDADRLEWKNATVLLKALPIGFNSSTDQSSKIHLRNVKGYNTQVNFSNEPMVISTFVDTLMAASLLKDGNDPVQVEGFNINGNNLFIKTEAVQINAALYNIAGTDPSSVSGVYVQQHRGRDSLNIRSAKVDFTTNLNDLFANNLHLSDVNASGLVVNVIKRDTAYALRDSTIIRTPIRIDKLSATEPVISISNFRNKSVSTLNIPWSPRSRVEASDILVSDDGLHIGGLLVNTKTATFTKPTGETVGVEKGNIEVDVSDINYGKTNSRMKWNGSINRLVLENEKGLDMGSSKNRIFFKNAALGNVQLSSDYILDFGKLIKSNIGAWLHIPEGRFIDSVNTIKWYNAQYTNSNGTLNLDSFVYHPTASLDTVLARAPYQLDYITFKTGAVSVNGMDLVRFQQDSSFTADSILIDKPLLTIFRDKKPPLSPFKKAAPMPVSRIKNISLPVYVQSIRVTDGTALYSEKTAHSRKQGDVLFTHIDGLVENIRNNDLLPGDSLSLVLQASFLDSAYMNLQLRQSYADSLGGFSFTAGIHPANITVINPVLVPLANIKVVSGTLDTASFRVKGTKYFALGESDIHYSNLRVKLIKNGNPDKSTLMQHIRSFIANNFIIKRNNAKRTGMVYYKRSRSQSFVNYILKIGLSGVSSTIGLTKNRKYRKAYKEELKKSPLPPAVP